MENSEPREKLQMRVVQRREVADDIVEFKLGSDDNGPLEPVNAGAHITVATPSGAMRRYSIVNPSSPSDHSGHSDPDIDHYVIAVKKDAASRGGSVSMHEALQEGDSIDVEPPQNDFPLSEAPEYLLIAGGIGVTPIYSMARQLSTQNKPFLLIYCVRSANEAAYLDELRDLCGEQLLLHEDGGDAERVFDFWDLFETPGKAHVFCCGPQGLMEEIRAISGHWPEKSIHFEDFKPIEVVRQDDSAFDVVLAKQNLTLEVPADRTILETLRDAGITVPSSCESGTCGTCKCNLLEGTADHRDSVLMDDEKSDHIMICVSRAREGSLVLDL